MNNPIRILLVDDSPYFLDAMRDFLNLQTTLSVAGTATEGQDALAQARQLNPDIILLDLNLGQQSGLDLIPLFKQQVPKTKIVILTIMQDETYRAAAMQAGADAFVHKAEMSGTLLSIIFGLADVSAANVSGKALLESGEQFRTLFENAPIGIGVADLQGNLLAFNDAMLTPGQYSRADIEQMGNVAALYYDPLERMEALSLFQQQGFVKGFEARLRRKDGSPYHAVLSLTRTIFNGQPAIQAVVEDVTERRQAQEALREAELRYRSLFEQTHDAVFLLDLQGRHLSANQRAAAMLGYDPKEIQGLCYKDTSAEIEQSEEILERLLRGEHIPLFERVFRRKDGALIPVEVNVELVRDARGNPLHIQSAVRDITERRRDEASLRLQSAALEATANSIVITDRDGHIQWANVAYTELTGYSLEEVKGKNPRLLSSGLQNLAFYKNMWDTILSGQAWHGELVNKRKDGSLYNDEMTITPLLGEDGQITHFIGVKQNITERKRADETIRQSEDRYRDLVEHIHDLIGTHDLQGNILSINPAASKLLGIERDALLKMNLRDLLTPEARVEFNNYLAAIQRDGRASGIMLVQTASGEKRIWEYDNTLRTDSVETPVVRALARDVTERSHAEQALRQSEDEYRRLFQNNPQPMWAYEPETLAFLAVNDAAVMHYGYSRGEFLAMTIKDIRPPEDVPALLEETARLPEGLNQPKVWRHIKKDGAVIFVEIRSHWGTFAGKRARIISVNDVTERKQAEDEIRSMKEFDEKLINNMSEGIVVQNVEGFFTYVNPAVPAITGYPPIELIGKHWTRFIPAEQHKIIIAADRQRIHAGEASQYEVEFLHKSGKRISLLVSGSPLYEKDQFTGTMAVFTDITGRKQAEEKIHMQLERLTALREIDQTINSTFDVHLSLNALILHTARLLSVDAVTVLLLDPITNMLEYGAGVGFWTDASKSARVKLGESYAGKAAKEQHIMNIPNLADDPCNMLLTGMLGGEKFVSYYGIPLIVKGKVIGVLEVFHRSIVERDGEWFDFFNTLAGQAAIAIDNAKLFENLQISNTELVHAYEATIEGWSRALDLRDEETEGHTQRVTEKVVELARLMGFSDEELVHVRRGGLLHDIGKMGVPDSILLKPAALTDDEWKIMRRHPVFAFELLSPIRYLKSAAIDIPYCHHEKWDGTGYPRGLKGGQIPLAARIFSIVDVYDALTSDRPYRAKWTHEKTLDYIKSLDGIQFDPQVVSVFFKSLS